MSATVITRFPPSPTGFLHIGGVRTALFNYLFAAHAGGTMVLRFEDTDRERSKPEFEQDILDAMHWVGIPYELAAAYRQSERLSVYQGHVARLIEHGLAYEAEESENNPGKKVIRFKNPNKVISFSDAVRDVVSFDTTDLGDFVIARSIDEPLYHLAVVIDDAEMGITHVIRGEEHISNTPRQILILEALSFVRPHYAHIPLILAPDKSKLSKRHGAVSATEYRAQGFIPEALVNYLALLGWNPGGEQEIFSLEELSKLFTLDRVHKAGAVFDIEKLKWFNHEHLKRLTYEEYAIRFNEFAGIDIDIRLVSIIKERARTLKEAHEVLVSEFGFIEGVAFERELLLNKGKIAADTAKKHLEGVDALLEPVGVTTSAADIKAALMPYADEHGRGEVLWPLRVTLSGKEKSPDPFTIISIIGIAEARERIAQALKKL